MANNTDIKTPNNKLRSLGLRRSTQKNLITKTPLSDAKVSYKSLQTPSETDGSSPFTPRLSQPLVSCSSTCTKNSLSNRLSLNRGAREKYKKKKLEFAANNLQTDSESFSNLRKEVANKEKLLQRHQKHTEKVAELKSVIAIWSEAFKASLEELSSKIEPRMESEDLIARLGIPPDLIDNT